VFELHRKLANDTVPVSETDQNILLLANDARFPWLILVPKVPGLQEIYDLSDSDQQDFMRVSTTLGKELMQVFGGDKFNVAALGNQVPQLHVHHIVRYKTDAAWPDPIWGIAKAKPYAKDRLEERLELLQSKLSFAK